MTTLFVGSHYQVENGVVVKYYFAGAQRIAMRKSGTLSYILTDHLGSTSMTTNASGALISQLKYKAWGETRYSSGSTPTNYKYTGQREEAGFGLYFYNARWYDPVSGRFSQADTIIPPGVQGWDRYAYTRNNPLRYTDPTGHIEACDDAEFCKIQRQFSKLSAIDSWKKIILGKFGITMSDDGGKNWDLRNTFLAYSRLSHINELLAGKLKSIIDKAGGAIFDLKEYTGEGCPKGKTCSYGGWTDGTHITFSTTGGNAIVVINFYHEFGHLLNSLPGQDNIFSNQLDALDNPSFISNNYVNKAALAGNIVEPIQASNNTVTEQWGDVFANYAAGNIDLSKPTGPGADMYNFVTGVFDEYLSNPTR